MSFLAKESQNVEYKLQWRDDYIRWICGFANANGGKIYIGVDDNGLVKGVNNASKLMEDIPNKVRDLIGLWTVFHIKTGHKTNHKTDHKETMRLSIAQREILNLLASNPSLTQKELVKEVGISLSGIKYNLSQLVKYGLLTRMGGKKSGHWVVTDRQN